MAESEEQVAEAVSTGFSADGRAREDHSAEAAATNGEESQNGTAAEGMKGQEEGEEEEEQRSQNRKDKKSKREKTASTEKRAEDPSEKERKRKRKGEHDDKEEEGDSGDKESGREHRKRRSKSRSRSRSRSRSNSRDRGRRKKRRSGSSSSSHRKEGDREKRRRDKERDRDRDDHRSRRRHSSRSDRERRTRSRERSRDRDRERRDRDRDRKERKKERERERKRSKEDEKEKGREEDDDKRRANKERRSGWDTAPSSLVPGSAAGIDAAKQTSGASTIPAVTNPALLQSPLIPFQQQALLASRIPGATPESLACRVYVGNLNFDCTEQQIREMFRSFGPIKSVTMSKDPVSNRFKGFCFVEYTYPDAANAALTLNGQMLGDRQIKVGRPYNPATLSITNLPLHQQQVGILPGGLYPSPSGLISPPIQTLPINSPTTSSIALAAAEASNQAHRIYVGSVNWDLTADDLKHVFESFGTIKSCVLMPNPETGKHKGYGFIEYDNPKSAEDAIAHMNGLELGGRTIKVNRAVSSNSMTTTTASSTASLLGSPTSLLSTSLTTTTTTATHLNPNALAMASSIAQSLAQRKTEESLSREDNMTISNPNQRYEIMQKLLARSDSSSSSHRCVVLRNMVGPEDVDEDLETEVMEECSKYGVVEKVVIYQERQSERAGDVIVKILVVFQAANNAQLAQRNLHGRFFAGRCVQADIVDERKVLEERYNEV